MVLPVVGALLAVLLIPAMSLAQLPVSPVPLDPGVAPRSIEPEPLPPIAPAPEAAGPSDTPSAPGPTGSAPGLAPPPLASPAGAPGMASPRSAPGSAPGSVPGTRIFCEQQVAVQLADRGAVPERYRPFVGIWSDAAWTPALCAALIVEQVTPEGTATLVYVFGPMRASPRGPNGVGSGVGSAVGSGGGVLHGTGIIRDGELRFQNSDGSQFAFRPLYADLGGRLTTPQGQSYEAIFKKTP